MDISRLAGIFIIAGFIIFWAGNLYSPPGVYQERDTDVRLQIIERYPLRWVLSQGVGGLGIVAIALGLLILSIHLGSDHSPWLTYVPAAATVLAAVLAVIYLYRYLTDPASTWASSQADPFLFGAALLTLAAGFLYGFLFLQAGLPAWLGYLTIGYTIIGGAALIIFKPPTFYVIALYYFIALAAGIALVR
jgi:hypothetical protein